MCDLARKNRVVAKFCLILPLKLPFSMSANDSIYLLSVTLAHPIALDILPDVSSMSNLAKASSSSSLAGATLGSLNSITIVRDFTLYGTEKLSYLSTLSTVHVSLWLSLAPLLCCASMTNSGINYPK